MRIGFRWVCFAATFIVATVPCLVNVLTFERSAVTSEIRGEIIPDFRDSLGNRAIGSYLTDAGWEPCVT